MELFNDTFVPDAVSAQWFCAFACPRCGHRPLRLVTAGGAPRWLCTSCDRCWRAVHGTLKAVDPIVCAGCAYRLRADCVQAVYGTFPCFGTSSLFDDTALEEGAAHDANTVQ